MFKLDLSSTYWWPVQFAVPEVDGLHLQDMSFEAQFRRHSQAQLDALRARIVEKNLSDTDIAREVVAGWRKVVGDDGGDIPFSAETLNRLLAVPAAGSAIMKAFYESISEGLEKNSPRLPKHGRAAA